MLIDKYSLFIFDWDGTLSTSTSLVKISRMFKKRYSISDIRKKTKLYKVDTVSQMNTQEEINRLYSFMYDMYAMFYKPKLKKGVLELLKLLKKRGKKVAIFSDSNKHRLFIETRKLGVMNYVDFMLSADTIKRFKPNPTGITMIIKAFKYKKSKCLYIGDMASDMFAAKFAGVDSCAVGDGVDSYALLKSLNPNHIVKDLKSLKSAR